MAIARLSGRERNFTGEHFRARGYAGSTVGFGSHQVHQNPSKDIQARADANATDLSPSSKYSEFGAGPWLHTTWFTGRG